MSIIETIAPRGRGRPPKPRDQESTPLEIAMSEPLPSQLVELVAQLRLACDDVDKIYAVYRETAETARMTPELSRKAARRAVESAEEVVDVARMRRREIQIDLNAARARVEEAEALDGRAIKYPGAQREEDNRLAEAQRNLAELLEEKERNDTRLVRDEERLAQAKQEEAVLEKDPQASAFDAWQRAIAKREVAEQLGHSDNVPTVEEVEELRAVHEKAKLDAAAPVSHRLDALREEYARAVQTANELRQRLDDLLLPYTIRWREAAEEQVATAAKLIAQAQQLQSLMAEDGDVHNVFTYPRVDSAGYHRADPRIAGGEAMREVYLAIQASSSKVSRRL